jgi:hypothetical protein
MTADGAVALRDIRPFDVAPQVQKHAEASLVCAFGQNNFVAFVELRYYMSRHVCVQSALSENRTEAVEPRLSRLPVVTT